MYGLRSEEAELVMVTRRFVDTDVRPVARQLEHDNTYPESLIEQMKAIGIFGLAIPEPWGAGTISSSCMALVTEELARGWMSLAGAMGGHTVVSTLLREFGTPEQQDHYLPKMATGEIRAAMALTEPSGGSDLQAMLTVARRDGDSYIVNGTKTWITNARRAGVIALLCKTDPAAEPRHRGISILLVEHGPGLDVSKDLPKLGYRGVESCELHFDGFATPSTSLLGGVEGRGFAQMMRGLEVGRLQVAGRAVGVGRAAYEDSLRYAQEREAFQRPIWRHQAVGSLLAGMATKLEAARQLLLYACIQNDTTKRADLTSGMAKLFASETALEVTMDAIRVHGGNGYSTEFDVERYYRDSPLMVVGEGTNEVLRDIIVRRLIAENRTKAS